MSRSLRFFPLLLVLLPLALLIPLLFRPPGPAEILYGSLLFSHIACGFSLLLGTRRRLLAPRPGFLFLLVRMPELLFSLEAVLFLFSYIYATNANMDYVQRFMFSHGNLRLAPNTTQERLTAYIRFLPVLALDALWYVYFRLRTHAIARRALGGAGFLRTWSLPFAIVSGILYALAFPSLLKMAGIPVLGWFCLVPLMLCLAEAPLSWGIFYGTLAGVLQTMISNYWLGTFNLLTLQFVSVVTALEYAPFMAITLVLFRRGRAAVAGRFRGAGFLVLPAAWTAFDWLRSMGFLGYPWGMLGASQYSVIPLIQIASATGVWGVTFLVTLSNSVIAWYAGGALSRVRRGPLAAVVLAMALAATLGWAGVRFAVISDGAKSTEYPAAVPGGFGGAKSTEYRGAGSGAPRSVRLALIQQNDDPRKDDYQVVFNTLRRLTDHALASDPDMVVWSETAFVPNIRRWSTEDPLMYPYAALVRDFLAYQKGNGRWLLTGNDDYSLSTRGGVDERLDYNGSVLFSPQGERVETYHKLHLVPFTEYFPFKKQLPGIYKLLQSFDAYLWEPVDRRVVFRHPKFAFSTPICFEDVFPNDVRQFVRAGAEVILNLSNDYWSLTETEGMQHAANAIFRAVENGIPLVRASASGLTCLVDASGRITARSPFYEESSLVVDVPISRYRETPYTRWGDWFPVTLLAFLIILLAVRVAWRRSR